MLHRATSSLACWLAATLPLSNACAMIVLMCAARSILIRCTCTCYLTCSPDLLNRILPQTTAPHLTSHELTSIPHPHHTCPCSALPCQEMVSKVSQLQVERGKLMHSLQRLRRDNAALRKRLGLGPGSEGEWEGEGKGG